MTKQEISEEIQALFVTIDAMLEQYGLEVAAFPQFAAIYEAAQQRVASVSTTSSNTVLASYPDPNKIPKGQFIKEMQKWIKAFKDELEGISSEVPVSKKTLRDFLKSKIRNTPNFPITQDIWKAIDDALPEGDKVTPKAFVDAVKKSLSQFQNKDILTSKYGDDNGIKDIYKNLKKSELDKYIMPTEGLYKELLDKVRGAEEEAKKEQEKEEEKREKEEEKRQEELKKVRAKAEEKTDDFFKTYEKWRNTQKEICAKIISQDQKTDSVNLMSKNKFMAILLQEGNLWAKYQPELTKELLSNIMNELKDEEAPVSTYVKAMNNALSPTVLNISNTIVASNWFVNPTMPEFYSLQTALVTENEGYGTIDLMEEYLDWFQDIGAVVDSLNTPKSQQFIIEKVLDGIKQRFNGRKELELLYAPFEKMLNKFKTSKNPKYCSKGELSYAWSESLYSTITNTSILNDSLDDLMSSRDKGFIDGISDTLKGLVNSDSLERIFLDSRRPVVKPKGLANGENLHTQLVFSDGTDLTNTFITEIVRVNNIPCVIPTDVTATIASNRENGYSYEIKDFVAQSPIINGKEGVTVYFEYKVYFERSRGSSTTGSEDTTETGLELGAEESVTNIALHHFSLSNTTGVSGEVGTELKPPKWVQLLGFDAKVNVGGGAHTEFTVGYEGEFGTEKTTGSSIALSVSKSRTTSESQTKDHGKQAGYFLVKGELYTHEIDQKGKTLVVTINKKASPQVRNGLKVFSPNPENKQTLYWAKD